MKLSRYDHGKIKRIAQTLTEKATPHQIDMVWWFVSGLTKEKAPADAGTSTEAATTRSTNQRTEARQL